jgi:hypothetical protein
MRNTEKVRRSTAPNLLVQYPLAELTLQLAVNLQHVSGGTPANSNIACVSSLDRALGYR